LWTADAQDVIVRIKKEDGAHRSDGLFVKETSKFIITDSLQVVPVSTFLLIVYVSDMGGN